jgi:hypothetical protein
MGKFSKILGFTAPKVQSTAPVELKDEEAKSKKSKRNQFLTEGQVVGQELSVGQVGGRNTTTFGN